MSIINVKSQTDLSGFYIIFKGSVQNEKNGTLGLSHLSEHLVCKHFDHLQDKFDIDGISWNAYTSVNEIVFYFTGLDKYVKKYKKEFLNSILTGSITEEEFLNEKNIVLEEYKDTFNQQGTSHYLNLMRTKFNHFSAIGLKSDLENITFDKYIEFVKEQYGKPHMIVNVSKRSNFESDVEFSDKVFNKDLVFGNYNNTLEITNEYVGKTSIMNISPVVSDDIPYIKMICEMLGGGLKSPLYQEIREKRGLVYFVHCYFDMLTTNNGIITISSETSDKNVKEFQKIVEKILNNPKKYLTKKRFNIVKKSFEIKLKRGEILRYNNINKFLNPKEHQMEQIIKTVTFDKIMDVYNKHFKFENFYKSIDKEEFL